jgi:hypothetical protein
MKKYPFGFNGNKEPSDWVLIQFVNLSKEQMEHLFKAEKELLKAGVSFDTGYSFGTKTRDWEWDWSLKGARVRIKKELKV